MIKRRLLVIENQLKQFQTLTKLLEDESDFLKYDTHEERFDVYPKTDDYTRVLDWIRVYLGPYYEQARKDSALELLVDYIQASRVELFLIDFTLSGSYEGGTGITLVNALKNKESSFKQMPTIFLSRTMRNDQRVKDTMPNDENIQWVEKGYAGFENLEKTYFENYVKKIIPGFIGKSDFSNQLEIIERLHTVYEPAPELKELLIAFKHKLFQSHQSLEANLKILQTLETKQFTISNERIKDGLNKLIASI
ncbi:hypothetical protein [Mucilaginibacter ginsenosidivorans]|uniref:Response regulator n=1 Tax=Mucilaginibacter ginsenosidivorans TaxID=398053 RepID=A0A5B8UTT3_9SPHI|nr:hypothetical protein [Mucilaginibacter ginsenosidivorans]QEC62517.1 hypothetical protein FRZ54_07920 [Mucilaginibacter ginsenosidivorans]